MQKYREPSRLNWVPFDAPVRGFVRATFSHLMWKLSLPFAPHHEDSFSRDLDRSDAPSFVLTNFISILSPKKKKKKKPVSGNCNHLLSLCVI